MVVPFPTALVLVCRDCRHRSNGPKKSKTKDLAQELKRLVRLDRPKPRVVMTTCLGLCPRGATAIALIGGTNTHARIAAVAKVQALTLALPLLKAGLDEPPTTP